MDITEFREKGHHLPEILKDFHDQKDFFKAFYNTYSEEFKDSLPEYNWRDNQIFTIDFLLWFLALHGYSIQKIKTKRKVNFRNIHDTIKEYDKKSLNSLQQIFNQNKNV